MKKIFNYFPLLVKKNIILFLVLGTFMLPDLIVVAVRHEYKYYLINAFMAFLIPIIFLPLFRKSIKVYAVFLLIIFLSLGMIGIGCTIIYGKKFSDEYLSLIIFNSYFTEMIGFLESTHYIPILGFIALIAFCYFTIKNLPKKVSYKKSLYTSATAIVLTIIVFSINVLINKKEYYTKIFPYYELKATIGGFKYISNFKKLFAENKLRKYNAKDNDSDSLPRIHILVIGESSTRYHWSMFGYNRNTNPLLSKQKNIVPYTDAICGRNLTFKSVCMMVTPVEPNNFADHWKKPGLCTLFKEAGYKSLWYVGQGSAFDISFHVNEADSVLHPDSDYLYEGAMLKMIREIKEKKLKKVFLVCHTKGSHFIFRDRYADEFDIFKPSIKRGENVGFYEIEKKDKMVNTYDNTIIYTDYILSKSIDIINQSGIEATLTFASDHGQELFDTPYKMWGHGTNITPQSYGVPMFFWYNDEFANHHPDKIKMLHENKNKPVNTAVDFFHSYADFTGISFNEFDSTKSFFSPAFKIRDREVSHEGKVFGYDSYIAKMKLK